MTSTAGGRIAIVTGAGSGVGRAVARALLNADYRVALLGRRRQPLEETIALAGSGEGLAIDADVSVEADVDCAFDAVVAHFGRIDLLFNNAGIFPPPTRFDALDFATWRGAMAVNLDGAFLCARAAFRHMARQSPPGGRIINNGSISAHAPRPDSAAYTVSKHAITGLTKSLMLDGRAHDIACGQIDIGNAGTALTADFSKGMKQADGSTRGEPMMPVADVAEAVLLMAGLPLGSNVAFLTVMASAMPYIGRG